MNQEPFKDFSFLETPDNIEAYAKEASERLNQVSITYPNISQLSNELSKIDKNTGLTYQQLMLLIIALHANEKSDPHVYMEKCIVNTNIDHWLSSKSVTHLWDETVFHVFGDKKGTRIKSGEIIFQWKKRYHVSAIERWIRPLKNDYKEHNYGWRIGHELARHLGEGLELSFDDENWLAKNFEQGIPLHMGTRTEYTGEIHGVCLKVSLQAHSGQSFCDFSKRFYEDIPLIKEALNYCSKEKSKIIKCFSDFSEQKIGVCVRLCLHRLSIGISSNVSISVFFTYTDSRFIESVKIFDLEYFEKDKVFDEKKIYEKIEKLVKPSLKTAAKNKKLEKARISREHMFDSCNVTSEILSRVEKWDESLLPLIKDGKIKSISIPHEWVSDFVSKPKKGNDVKINFLFANGKIRSSLRISPEYSWQGNKLHGPGAYSESVMSGMIGKPAKDILAHPFAKLVGPVSSVKSYGNRSTIVFRTKKD